MTTNLRSHILYLLSASILMSSVAQAIEVKDILERDRKNSHIRSIGMVQPIAKTDLQLTYDLRDMKLYSSDTVYLEIPDAYKNMTLDFVALTHRQDPKYEYGECRSSDRDCNPGYTSMEFFDKQQKDIREGWRYWGGVGSGPLNSKFAEIRSHRGETDNLYEWQKKGHSSVETQRSSKNAILPQLARIRSLGPDMIRVQRVIFKFLPPAARTIREKIFADGLVFGDYATASGRRYPGYADRGDYGNALALRPYETTSRQLPQGWSAINGGIRLPLSAGERLLWLDIAVGDMKRVPKGGTADDYRGASALTVKRLRHGQVVEILMDDENVGTNGVMRALPAKISQVVQNGEELEITASGSSAKVMGIRSGSK